MINWFLDWSYCTFHFSYKELCPLVGTTSQVLLKTADRVGRLPLAPWTLGGGFEYYFADFYLLGGAKNGVFFCIKICRDLRIFWETLGKKSALFWSKTVFLGQELHYCMVYCTLDWIEFAKLQVRKKTRICRENSKKQMFLPSPRRPVWT